MLLDTSGLLCYYHAGERQHADAGTYFNAAPTRLTHSYVLAEFVPLCQSRRLNRVRALEFAADLMDDPLVEVVWVDEPLHRAALAFLQSKPYKAYSYSLCDAVSFVLMRRHGIREALTTDRHFEDEGFTRLLRA